MVQAESHDGGLNRKWWLPIVIVVAVFTVINTSILGLGMVRYANRPSVDIGEVQVEGATDLCPGDSLDYSFRITATSAGTVDLITSIIETNTVRPTLTRFQQFVLEEDTSFVIRREYVIPSLYEDPMTGKGEKWVPGGYIQRTTARMEGSSVPNRRIEVPFNIKDGCLENSAIPTDTDTVTN